MVEKSKRDYGPLDVVQEAMGVMGPWQILIAIALSFVNIPVAWQQLSIAVLAPKTSFTCNIPVSMSAAIPSHDACAYSTIINNVSVSHECTNFTFHNEGLNSTMITEYNLVCGRSSLKNFAQAFTMLGILAGNMLFGTLADKYGRKIPLLVALVLQVVSGLLSAIVPWYTVFAILKVVSAFATGGTMLVSFVLLMEIVGIEWRSTLSVLFHIPFVLGHMSIALLAYVTGTYFSYSLAISLPPIVLLSYYWLIPESPRWLLAAGKVEEARAILEEAATKNNIPLEKVNAAIEFHSNQNVKDNKDNNQNNTYSIFDLFKTPNLRIRTICIAFNWLVCGFCFFGLAHYVSRLDARIYYNIFISAAFELGGIMIVWIFIHRVSRLKLLMCGNVIAGISLLVLTLVTGEAQVWIMSVGCCAMSVSFTVVYLYSSELFPTVVRNNGIALCSVSARIASTVVPFIATSGESTKDNNEWLVSVIFGIGPLIGAALCVFLPETMDCQLPETIEDGENFGKKIQSIPVDEEAK